MPKTKECPKCGVDISDSYEVAEPDVGIFGTSWFCDACDLFVESDDESDDEPYDRDGYGSGSDGW